MSSWRGSWAATGGRRIQTRVRLTVRKPCRIKAGREGIARIKWGQEKRSMGKQDKAIQVDKAIRDPANPDPAKRHHDKNRSSEDNTSGARGSHLDGTMGCPCFPR